VSIFIVLVVSGCSNHNEVIPSPKVEAPLNPKAPEQMNNDIVFPGDALTYLSSKELIGQSLQIPLNGTQINLMSTGLKLLLQRLRANFLRGTRQGLQQHQVSKKTAIHE